jgi:hypothetical protein
MIPLKQIIPTYIFPAFESLLESHPDRKYRWLLIAWLVGLYILGIVGFGIFFNWGDFTMEYHDWADITGPRIQFVRTATRAGQFPLHISDPSTLHGYTLRYLAIPDAFASPQYIIALKLPLPVFSMFNVLGLYTLGFAGLLVLRAKLRLSPVSFAVLLLLFNFNGHILAHYNVGHTTFGGYFLFPWFVWLILRLIEGDRSWLWTTLTAFVLFAIWLQGSYHQFVWLLILLAAIGIFVPRTFWTVVRTGFFTFLVCAFRILPPILLYQKQSTSFMNGYPSLFSIWDNLVNIPDPIATPFFKTGLGYVIGPWEMACFIGLLGAVFLIFFGIYRGLILRKAPYAELVGPLGCILLLSMGQIYPILAGLPIPLLQGERVSARMFSVVLVFGLILAAERFQRWLDDTSYKPISVAASLVGLGIIGVDLWQNMLVWQIINRSKDFWIVFDMNKWYVQNNMADTIYLWLVFGGLAISVLTLLGLSWLSWREHRRKLVK